MCRDMSKIIGGRMRRYTKARFAQAECQNVFLSDIMKEQVLEYALMTGSYLGVRALVEEVAEAVKCSNIETLEQAFEKAKRGIAFLPDTSIGIEEMRDYGYLEEDMYPLREEEALNLYKEGNTIYFLYPDNTKCECISEEGLHAHYGIYGIEDYQWEWCVYHKRIQEESEWLRDMEMSSPFVVYHDPVRVPEDVITAPLGFRLKWM